MAAAEVPPGEVTMLRSCGRVHAAGLGEERAALERLDDQVVRDVAREAQVHGGIDERFHDQEHVGRACAADGRGHGHELLVLDLELAPRLPQERARLVALLAVTSGVAYQTVMPLPSCAGVLGMLRTIGDGEHVAQRGRGGAGEDADDQLPVAHRRRQLAADAHQHLRLDAQHDDVGAARRPPRCWPRRADAVVALQVLAPFGTRMAGHDLLRRRPLAASSPAIIDSAITPEPTVAMVRSVSGIGWGV